jgi:hypothetical protein
MREHGLNYHYRAGLKLDPGALAVSTDDPPALQPASASAR